MPRLRRPTLNSNGLISFVLTLHGDPFHIHNHDVNRSALWMAVATVALNCGKSWTGKNAS
jgi:hypothetical protein